MLCDRHVVKMVLETAQMLSTVEALRGRRGWYKPTHERHPCTLWAAGSDANHSWLVEHGHALALEYTERFGKYHACTEHLAGLVPGNWSDHSPFVQAMPEHYRGENPVLAYRRYYLGEKARFAEWRHSRPEPVWWTLRDPELGV